MLETSMTNGCDGVSVRLATLESAVSNLKIQGEQALAVFELY